MGHALVAAFELSLSQTGEETNIGGFIMVCDITISPIQVAATKHLVN